MKVKSFYNIERNKVINLKQTPEGLHLEIRTAAEGCLSITLSGNEITDLAKALHLSASIPFKSNN